MCTEPIGLINNASPLLTLQQEITALTLINKSPPLQLPSPTRSPSSLQTTKECVIGENLFSHKQEMSVAFREVFKDVGPNRNEYQLDRTDTMVHNQAQNTFTIGGKLLFSNDNMRPKSRSKTTFIAPDIHKVSPCEGDFRLQYSSSAKLNRHLFEDAVMNSHSNIPTGTNEVLKFNTNNNAPENLDALNDSVKKGKRSKKRNSIASKNKKGKHGKIFTTPTSSQEKHLSFQQSSSNTQPVKPSRISSEPPSKTSPDSLILVDSASGIAQKNVSNAHSSSNKQVHNMYPLRVTSAKTNQESLPRTHYMHGNLAGNPVINNMNSTSNFEAQGQSVMIYKLEINSRVKSAAGLRLEPPNSDILNQGENSDTAVFNAGELSLNAVSCNLQHLNKSSKSVVKSQQKSSVTTQGLSPSIVSKEAVLTSIYGAVYNTADKVAAQVEELKKVKKIFLSDKQSGTLRESGMDYPCAPPATPTPDLMRRHEYIPCMSDIRSQRAVKSRLQVMEKEAHRKEEKRREANAKMEKQQLKDREKQTKVKQRREIYALNKVMTELENKRFLEFCQAKGLNKA